MAVEPKRTIDNRESRAESDAMEETLVQTPYAAVSLRATTGRLKWTQVASRLLLLTGVVGLAGLVAWIRNGRIHGHAGAELALSSMLVCGGSAAGALTVVGMTAGGPRAFAGLLCSILIRTLVPLAFGVVWQVQHRDWPVRNLIEVHVSLFFVSLTVETILVVDIVCSSVRSASSLNVFTPGKGRDSR